MSCWDRVKAFDQENLSAMHLLLSEIIRGYAVLWRLWRIQIFLHAITVYFLINFIVLNCTSSSSSKRKDHEVCEVSSWTIKQIMSTISHISAHFIDFVLIIYPTHVVVCVLQTLVCYYMAVNVIIQYMPRSHLASKIFTSLWQCIWRRSLSQRQFAILFNN